MEGEMLQLANSQDPEPDSDIGYLFVLSASNSYLRKEIKSVDLNDDYDRMNLAVKIAKKIASLKENIENEQIYGPKIVYNGCQSQNNDLSEALDEDLVGYPKNKFVLLDLPLDEINTKGQFISIKQDLSLEDNASIGIITHAYHYPRVSRMLGKNAPLNPFGKTVKISAFLVDREFSSPGIEEKREAEIRKIPIYVDKGDLSKNPCLEVTFLK